MEKKLKNFISKNYKHGFWTSIKKNKFPFGLNKNTISSLSEKKNEPINLKNYRLKAYKNWKLIKYPIWINLKYLKLNFKNLLIYSVPFKKKKKVKTDLFSIFQKCGVNLSKKKTK